MAMLIVTNPVVMTQVLAILVLVVLPSLYFGRRVRRLSRASQDRIADSSAIAAEVLNAVPVVQSYLQEAREAERFSGVDRARLPHRRDAHADALVPRRLHHQRDLRRPALGPLPGHAGGGARRHHGRPPGPDRRLRDHPGQQRRRALRGLRRPAARGRRDRAADGAARSCSSPIVSPPVPRALASPARALSVRFDDVTFRYPSRPQHPTLAHFSLAVEPGETVALVGPSGAGKSTVLQLILRFYDVESGAVRVDGERVDRGRARRAARPHRHRPAGQRDLLGRRDGEHPLRPARGERRRGRSPPRRPPSRTTSSPRCPRATAPSSASAACASRAASASASRSRGRC